MKLPQPNNAGEGDTTSETDEYCQLCALDGQECLPRNRKPAQQCVRCISLDRECLRRISGQDKPSGPNDEIILSSATPANLITAATGRSSMPSSDRYRLTTYNNYAKWLLIEQLSPAYKHAEAARKRLKTASERTSSQHAQPTRYVGLRALRYFINRRPVESSTEAQHRFAELLKHCDNADVIRSVYNSTMAQQKSLYEVFRGQDVEQVQKLADNCSAVGDVGLAYALLNIVLQHYEYSAPGECLCSRDSTLRNCYFFSHFQAFVEKYNAFKNRLAELEFTQFPPSSPVHNKSFIGKTCIKAGELMKSNINDRDAIGRTALHIALEEGANSKQLEYLIDLGVNVDEMDCLGRTAWHIAAKSKNIEALEVLLQADADCSLPFPNGWFTSQT